MSEESPKPSSGESFQKCFPNLIAITAERSMGQLAKIQNLISFGLAFIGFGIDYFSNPHWAEMGKVVF